MSDVPRVPIRVRSRRLPQTASPQKWRDEPLRTFATYVEALGKPENAHLRHTLAVDDLIRMARNALANELVNNIGGQKPRDARKGG